MESVWILKLGLYLICIAQITGEMINNALPLPFNLPRPLDL